MQRDTKGTTYGLHTSRLGSKPGPATHRKYAKSFVGAALPQYWKSYLHMVCCVMLSALIAMADAV
jgi:hypothetical protein